MKQVLSCRREDLPRASVRFCIAAARWGRILDDRFHETGIDETGSMELEGCWWIPRLRLLNEERYHGRMASSGRGGDDG
jgi:hypothetical protein